MLMDLMDDCKISHLDVHCSGQILCEVDSPKAVDFSKRMSLPQCTARWSFWVMCVGVKTFWSRPAPQLDPSGNPKFSHTVGCF